MFSTLIVYFDKFLMDQNLHNVWFIILILQFFR